jgi:hypothetical protein
MSPSLTPSLLLPLPVSLLYTEAAWRCPVRSSCARAPPGGWLRCPGRRHCARCLRASRVIRGARRAREPPALRGDGGGREGEGTLRHRRPLPRAPWEREGLRTAPAPTRTPARPRALSRRAAGWDRRACLGAAGRGRQPARSPQATHSAPAAAPASSRPPLLCQRGASPRRVRPLADPRMHSGCARPQRLWSLRRAAHPSRRRQTRRAGLCRTVRRIALRRPARRGTAQRRRAGQISPTGHWFPPACSTRGGRQSEQRDSPERMFLSLHAAGGHILYRIFRSRPAPHCSVDTARQPVQVLPPVLHKTFARKRARRHQRTFQRHARRHHPLRREPHPLAPCRVL